MAKTTEDLSFDAHQDGDADGLGCPRGIFALFGIEILAAIAYGLVLHFGIWR